MVYAYQGTWLKDPFKSEDVYASEIWKAIQNKGDVPVYVSVNPSGFMNSCISVFFVAKHYGKTPIAVIVLAIVALIAFIVTILNLPEIYYIVTSKQIPPEVTAPVNVTMILMLGLVIAGLYFLSKRGEK